ncbi:MAG: hypothetical protein H6745_12955 [Deltaproteobacteria bacterium]|nr:hypothetical protein [Deltaproteobacteria bacterium]
MDLTDAMALLRSRTKAVMGTFADEAEVDSDVTDAIASHVKQLLTLAAEALELKLPKKASTGFDGEIELDPKRFGKDAQAAYEGELDLPDGGGDDAILAVSVGCALSFLWSDLEAEQKEQAPDMSELTDVWKSLGALLETDPEDLDEEALEELEGNLEDLLEDF